MLPPLTTATTTAFPAAQDAVVATAYDVDAERVPASLAMVIGRAFAPKPNADARTSERRNATCFMTVP
jgi:hypothetical protein